MSNRLSKTVDIASETQKVGNALTSVRIDRMIVNLATGIARGQYELDKTSIEITKLMADPNSVQIGGMRMSMLEAGILPTFYHFVDTILEVKMEVKIREDIEQNKKVKESLDVSLSAGYKTPVVSVSTSVAYGRVVDTEHSQKFSQDMSASSLIRTKIVPKPVPEPLEEMLEIFRNKIREKWGSTPPEDFGEIEEGMGDDTKKELASKLGIEEEEEA